MGIRRALQKVTVLLYVALLIGCAGAGPRLTGQVLDAETGKPVADAEITIPDGTYLTDQIGRYGVHLDRGEHEVTFSAPGYVTRNYYVEMASRRRAQRHDAELSPRRLTGQVFSQETSEPLVGASITMGTLSAATDEQGAYDLLAPAPSELNVSAVGFTSGKVSAEIVAELYDSKGTLLSPLNITLAPRVLIGAVTDALSEEGVSGAAVLLGEQATTTDQHGGFRLSHVPSQGELTVSADGYREPVTLAYEGQSNISVTLEPWMVEVQVLDAGSDDPLARITIASDDTTAETDELGIALLRAEPGAMLTIESEGYHSQTITCDTSGTLTVRLEPSRLLAQVLNAETGALLPGARIIAYGPDGAAETMHADDTGLLDIPDGQGIERLLVKEPGYRALSQKIERLGRHDLAVEPFCAQGIHVPIALLTLPDRAMALLDTVQASTLNAVVLEMKSDHGVLAWASENEIAVTSEAALDDAMPVQELLAACHERDIYAIGRLVVFADDHLSSVRPEWAVRNPDDSLYTDNLGLNWSDPFQEGARGYNIDLAVELANLGFDEVQFDYVRFPSYGKALSRVYAQESTFESRTNTIRLFGEEIKAALETTPAFTSVDVFGDTARFGPRTDNGIGQRMVDIAPSFDYVCPMAYPYLFASGAYGFDRPALHPYEVLYENTLDARDQTDTLIRPWLQHSSHWGVTYDVPELLKQRKGVEDAGGCGWQYWNAAAKYRFDTFVPNAYSLVSDLPEPPTED